MLSWHAQVLGYACLSCAAQGNGNGREGYRGGWAGKEGGRKQTLGSGSVAELCLPFTAAKGRVCGEGGRAGKLLEHHLGTGTVARAISASVERLVKRRPQRPEESL